MISKYYVAYLYIFTIYLSSCRALFHKLFRALFLADWFSGFGCLNSDGTRHNQKEKRFIALVASKADPGKSEKQQFGGIFSRLTAQLLTKQAKSQELSQRAIYRFGNLDFFELGATMGATSPDLASYLH
jgi:hypothetical protein